MEDTLRVFLRTLFLRHLEVLILVLMEDTLRVRVEDPKNLLRCLNPCFNGRYSQRLELLKKGKEVTGLNPCFNGRYSQSSINLNDKKKLWVLILVLMEDTLRVQRLVSLCLSSFDVCLPL